MAVKFISPPRGRAVIRRRFRLELLEDRRLLSATVPDGTETLVNDFTLSTQQTRAETRAVAANAAGEVMVAFEGRGADGIREIYARRYNSTNKPLGGQFLVNTTTMGNQQYPSAALGAGGESIVAWSGRGIGDNDGGVFIQLFDNLGAPVGGETRVNQTTASAQQKPVVAKSPDGSFVVVWSGRGIGDSAGIFARHYASDGKPLTGEFRVNTTRSLPQQRPDVAFSPDGDYVICWDGNGPGDPSGVFYQAFDSADAPVGVETRVNTTTNSLQRLPSVAVDEAKHIWVTWSGFGNARGNADSRGVFVRGFDWSGAALTGETLVNTTTKFDQEDSSIAADQHGFVVTWTSLYQDGSARGVYCQEFDPTGAQVDGENLVNTTTVRDQRFSSVAARGVNRFVVGFSGNCGSDTLGVCFQSYQRTFKSPELLLDFGLPTSPTQAGYTWVTSATVFDAGSSFGWVTASAAGVDRGNLPAEFPQEDLRRDGNWGSSGETGRRTFRAKVANGTYYINVTMGDALFGRDHMQVRDADSGSIVIPEVTTAAGEFFHDGFEITVNDGSLDLEFSDLGEDPFWVVNGLEIRPATVGRISLSAADGATGPGSVAADTTSVDTFTGVTGLPVGTLITVTSSLGTITSDESAEYQGTQAVVVTGGGSGPFPNSFSFDVKRPIAQGVPLIRAEAVDGSGEGTGNDPAIATYVFDGIQFDMNNDSAFTQSGYVAVQPGTTYATGLGYGWTTTVGGFDRGAIGGTNELLLRDGHWAGFTTEDFRVDVPDGTYYVNVTMGDALFGRDHMQVRDADSGSIVIPEVTTAAGEFFHDGFEITVNDGSLDLEFSDLGEDPFWVVNGLEIRPATVGRISLSAADGATGPGSVAADATSVDTFTGVTGLAAGTLVTVTSSLGTITSDESAAYQGTQAIVVAGGGSGPFPNSFSFDVQRPIAQGVPLIRAEAVDGSGEGTGNDPAIATYVFDGLQFDMNNISALTQNGHVAVQPNTTYSTGLGYGWTTTVGGFDRGAIGGTEELLLRDGHWAGFTTKDFRIDLPDGTYEVTVTMGDGSFARDLMAVSVVAGGTGGASGITTAAGQFAHETLTTTIAGGQMTLRFGDAGGDPYWTLNGIVVREAPVPSFTLTATPASVPADGTSIVTFLAGGVPNGLYTLSTTLGDIQTTDADPRYQGIQVHVVDGFLGFAAYSEASGTEIATAEHVSGAARGMGTATYTALSRRFDLDSSTAVTASGFMSVGAGVAGAYTPEQGFGWMALSPTFDRGTPTDLLRDAHYDTDNTFLVDLPNGGYVVNVTLGDSIATRDSIDVYAEGTLVVDNLTTPAGQFAHRSFPVTIVDGQLTLHFDDDGGDPFFAVNAIEVHPSARPHALTPITPDGTLFDLSGATPGSTVTISTTMGNVSSTDQDPNYEGVQLIADAVGNVIFSITAPTSGGLATIRSQEVTGQGAGSTTFTYGDGAAVAQIVDNSNEGGFWSVFTSFVGHGVQNNIDVAHDHDSTDLAKWTVLANPDFVYRTPSPDGLILVDHRRQLEDRAMRYERFSRHRLEHELAIALLFADEVQLLANTLP